MVLFYTLFRGEFWLVTPLPPSLWRDLLSSYNMKRAFSLPLMVWSFLLLLLPLLFWMREREFIRHGYR